ncbi:MAG: helix-turn-helix transcriptional regulator, partial [Salibacteraceae bacterium]
MHFIPENLRHIRKQRKWTQDQFARHLGVKRSMIGAYEEGRADPRISFLLLVCQKFDLSMDDLVGKPIGDQTENSTKRISGSSLRILPIAMDQNEDI